MARIYAEADFPPMGSEGNPDRQKAAEDAYALFLKCRWSKMTVLDFSILHNSIRMSYKPGSEDLDLGMRHVYDTLGHLVDFMTRISRRAGYGLELWPPVYRDSHQQKVYALNKAVAKASYNGLSLSAYEKLMDIMMQDGMDEARCGMISTCFLFGIFAITPQANSASC